MTGYLLCHRHAAADCGVAFAAWRGFPSPLRKSRALGACAHGDHRLWWFVAADDEAAALAQLPGFVAARTDVIPIQEVLIP